MSEAKVKSYTRKTKSGKTVQVRAHTRIYTAGKSLDSLSGKEYEIGKARMAKKVAQIAAEEYRSKTGYTYSGKGRNKAAEHGRKARIEFLKGERKKCSKKSCQ